MKAGDSQTFEIRASYGRDSFGIIINGLLNSDSRLYKLQLSVDKKNRIFHHLDILSRDNPWDCNHRPCLFLYH